MCWSTCCAWSWASSVPGVVVRHMRSTRNRILAGLGVALAIALLQGFDAKFWGVVVMAGSVVLLYFVPWLDQSPVRSIRYRPAWHKALFGAFVLVFPDPRLPWHEAADRDRHICVSAADDRVLLVLSVDADLESARRVQAFAGAGHLQTALMGWRRHWCPCFNTVSDVPCLPHIEHRPYDDCVRS